MNCTSIKKKKIQTSLAHKDLYLAPAYYLSVLTLLLLLQILTPIARASSAP